MVEHELPRAGLEREAGRVAGGQVAIDPLPEPEALGKLLATVLDGKPDLRLAAEGALLGLPEARLGIVPDVGGSTRLAPAVGLVRAKELIFTGRQIDAALAERWGLVNQVAPADQLDAALDGLLAEIMQCAPLAVGMAKRLLNGMFDTPRGLALEGWAQSQLIATQDFGEGVQAMLQRRPAQFKGK